MGSLLIVAMLLHAGPASSLFTGTWVLDPERSALASGGTRDLRLVVVDKTTAITVADHRPSGTDEYSVPLDGQRHPHTYSGGVYARTVRRENGTLVWDVMMTRVADSASISYTERWSLSDGGRTLTVYTAYPGGRDVLKVFSKRE